MYYGGQVGSRIAAEKYDVTRSTLENLIKALKCGHEMIFKRKLGGFDSIFD